MELIGTNTQGDAINGTSTGGGAGVRGISTADNHVGVVGQNTAKGNGVLGVAVNGQGVFGQTQNGAGVYGQTANGDGLSGLSSSGGAGVRGISTADNHVGVVGQNTAKGNGVLGLAANGDGVWGESSGGGAGVRGISDNANHIGVVGENRAGGFAGAFFGNVQITGNLNLTTGDIVLVNADCAEDFDISQTDGSPDPGTVMVIDDAGALSESQEAYDRRVAGVISGGGDYKPGIVLDKQPSQKNRMAVALLGKVGCKADASYGPIRVGDLLTTSPRPGHAMKVADPLRAFGAVIGKALRPLPSGQGIIAVLVALQ